ncbi:hypothetical protein [Frondihabitans cladoniiphilus]|uniref:hypothetical protein n=1 Tax=Frondihabitans cladoniiphilus TaxID=715785 RepID=UPI0031E5D12F
MRDIERSTYDDDGQVTSWVTGLDTDMEGVGVYYRHPVWTWPNGVDAGYHRNNRKWRWSVGGAATEGARDGVVQPALNAAVEAAILSFPGVKHGNHEDREVWLISGRFDAEKMVRAVSAAEVLFVPAIKALYDDDGKALW